MDFIKDISRSKGNNARTWTTEIRIDDGERYLTLNRNSKNEKRQFLPTEKNKFLKMLLHQFRDIRSVAREPNQKVRGYERIRNKSNLITMRGSPSIQTPKNPDKSGIRSEVARVLNFQARTIHSVGLLPAVLRDTHSWHHRQSRNRLRNGSCTDECNDDSIFTRAGRWLANRPRSPAFRTGSHVTLMQFACII